jgi:hypothetical protein
MAFIKQTTQHPELSLSPDISEQSQFRPREIIIAWVKAFNDANSDYLALLYCKTAIYEQPSERPALGRQAIQLLLSDRFAAHRAEFGSNRTCIAEQMLEDGEWGVLASPSFPIDEEK